MAPEPTSVIEDSAPKDEVRKRPPLLRALGKREPPERITVDGREHTLDRTMKHDSWAATAIYADADGRRIVCKLNRQQPIVVVPMRWLGHALARRESKFLRRLGHVELIPDDLGPVTAGGKPLRHAAARVYIDGEPFTDASVVDAGFFADFRKLLDEVHAAGIAYVDLHKRENILIDREGRPHFLDFQVSYGGLPFVVRRLQEMDDYHYRKHYARCLPHTLTPEELIRYQEPPGFVRAHRKIAAPLRQFRRRLLTWMKVRDRSGHATSELEPEDAFRDTPPS